MGGLQAVDTSHLNDAEARFARLAAAPYPFTIPGIRTDLERMHGLWAKLLPEIQDCNFPEQQAPGLRYYYENNWFSYGDALIYQAMIRVLRPNRLVEVGSGYSSAVALETRDRCGFPKEMTFIDPETARLQTLLTERDRKHTTILRSMVQRVDPTTFESLEPGDLLFIDSSHIVAAGSDVHYLLCEVLPRLVPGVIVHFHDMFWPFEYPQAWVTAQKRGYNELYFLQAFLTNNDSYEILFFNDFFAKMHADILTRTAPLVMRNPGGGLWLRKTA